MDNLNWGTWARGLISALSTAAITVLVAIAVLDKMPQAWQLFVIGGIPLLLGFFAYIKENPPPFGTDLPVKPPPGNQPAKP